MTLRACLAALLVGLAASHAMAQDALPADTFEAEVTGKTITYQQFGQLFGVEEYLPDRQVRWSVAENLCQYGTWYPEGDSICFVYENDPTPHCWTFWLEAGALAARSANDLPGAELYESDRSDIPLACPGPDVGA